MNQKDFGKIEEIIDILIPTAHICFHLLIALTKARIVSMVLRVMTRPNFIPEKERKQIEENKINIDKDLEKYFDYKE